MSEEYQYIIIAEKEIKPKTKIWAVFNKSSRAYIGQVKWHSPRRCYCFFPWIETIFSAGCMQDIASFISGEMKKRG